MKKLIPLLIAFIFVGCDTVEPDNNYTETEGYILYKETKSNYRFFDVHQSNLDEDLISISVTDLPFEPIRKQLFYFEGECKKFTNVCTVDKIVGVSYRYP